jgi:fatty acid desaturase
MTKAEYLQIRDSLSFQRRFVATAGFLAVDLLLLALGLWLATRGGTAGYVLSQFLFAVLFFHHFAILHECGHETASARSWLNTLTGHYASLFCFMPYYPWKYIHSEHHAWAGNVERDPTLKAVRDYRPSNRLTNGAVRLAWRTWVPLLAFIQHLVLWSYPLMLLKMGQLRGRRLLRCVASVLLLPVAYAGLHLCVPEYFNLANFGWSFVIYLVLVELINFPHHLGTEVFHTTSEGRKLPLWEQARVTRSCYYPPVVSELLLLNFNFHIEHHLFPNLPWHELRKARRLLRQALGSSYQECVGISWNVENRKKDIREVFLIDAGGETRHPQWDKAPVL